MEVENVCDVLGTPGPWRIRRLGRVAACRVRGGGAVWVILVVFAVGILFGAYAALCVASDADDRNGAG